MTVSAQTRAAVRTAFGGRCGYCGVSEASVGGELEIDHFHPLAAGGSDELENLVYACTACNRFKGDYAPARDAPESLQILHPKRDDVSAHVAEPAHGRLLGVTPRGWFHIQRAAEEEVVQAEPCASAGRARRGRHQALPHLDLSSTPVRSSHL
jgi:hypothetical protein